MFLFTVTKNASPYCPVHDSLCACETFAMDSGLTLQLHGHTYTHQGTSMPFLSNFVISNNASFLSDSLLHFYKTHQMNSSFDKFFLNLFPSEANHLISLS